MSITDELREWAHARFAGGFSDVMEREVDEIADRIDEQHRKALEKVAAMVDACPLDARVALLERKLNHKGL